MKRFLSEWEITEAELVFGRSVRYWRIRIHENVRWTNAIGRIGAFLRGEKAPQSNAVTLGNHIFFPQTIVREGTPDSSISISDMAWLVHELTHVWQHQNLGWWILLKTLWLHLSSRHNIYAYGGKKTLQKVSQSGGKWEDFNTEQQGDICRDYYISLKKQRDTSPWLPFLRDIQNARNR